MSSGPRRGIPPTAELRVGRMDSGTTFASSAARATQQAACRTLANFLGRGRQLVAPAQASNKSPQASFSAPAGTGTAEGGRKEAVGERLPLGDPSGRLRCEPEEERNKEAYL